LLYLSSFPHFTKLEDLAICGRYDSIRTRVDRPTAGLQLSVEKLGKVAVAIQRLSDFVKVYSKYPAVKFETRDAEKVWEINFVEAAPII
jgi:hypothetical protein